MEDSLLRAIKKEKLRQAAITIITAILLSVVVLAISYGLWQITTDENFTDNSDSPGSNENNVNNFVLDLNNYMNTQFNQGQVSYFNIAGNITNSIHPSLIDSFLFPENGNWNVSAWVLNESTPEPFDVAHIYFEFSDTQVQTAHTTFLNGLNQTTEVPNEDIPDTGTVPQLLYFQVLYDDFTGLNFIWMGYDELDIIQVGNLTWSEDQFGVSIQQNFDDVHNLSPLSAFDPFISYLQDIYSQHLN